MDTQKRAGFIGRAASVSGAVVVGLAPLSALSRYQTEIGAEERLSRVS